MLFYRAFVYILFTNGKTCVAGGNTFFVVASAFSYFLFFFIHFAFSFCCFVYFRNYAVRIYLYEQYGIFISLYLITKHYSRMGAFLSIIHISLLLKINN